MNKLAIVLVSGGMDSCVTAAIGREDYELAFLHVNYGQKTELRELKSFHDIADFYDVEKRLIVNIDYLKHIGGSSLTDDMMEISTSGVNDEIPSSYVPFRNTHIIAMAVSWAEVIGAEKIFIGAVEEDSSGYPDCTKSYYEAYNRLIEVGTKPSNHIEIITPVIDMRKSEIVKKGIALGAPLHLTWSCYGNNDGACGECDSCLLRLRGFREAGVEDPIGYVIKK
jgi:7-cyano-7-deazaguanine synthase